MAQFVPTDRTNLSEQPNISGWNFVMGIENFVGDALYKPNDYISYYVGRKLKEMHPGKTVIEGEANSFDLEAFVRAGKCSVVEEPPVFNNIKTVWKGPGRKLRHESQNGWLNVLWEGHLLDVVLITWADECYRRLHYWIIADSTAIAESFFRAVCEWSAEPHDEVIVYDDGWWRKSEELFKAIKSASFDNLILTGSLKQEIQDDFARFFDAREVYDRYRIPWRRGILFIGPPGNGKTHTVKAIVNTLKRPCIYVKSFRAGDEQPQDGMRRVFDWAKKIAPCVMVLEDIDSLVDRNSLSFFLNELDGFAINKGVVVLATTNHPKRLDPAIVDRPSRFDRKYYFNLPKRKERLEYLSTWNSGLEADMRASEKGVGQIAAATKGFSFAYMKELCLSSMMGWMALDKPACMDGVIVEQAKKLREQMTSEPE